MTLFDDDCATVAVPAWMERFGESVEYQPKGGTPRTITAIVERNPPEGLPGPPSAHAPLLHVSVRDNATTGISRTELNAGGDRIELSVWKGDAVKSMVIQKLLADTAGMLRLEVR